MYRWCLKTKDWMNSHRRCPKAETWDNPVITCLEKSTNQTKENGQKDRRKFSDFFLEVKSNCFIEEMTTNAKFGMHHIT